MRDYICVGRSRKPMLATSNFYKKHKRTENRCIQKTRLMLKSVRTREFLTTQLAVLVVGKHKHHHNHNICRWRGTANTRFRLHGTCSFWRKRAETERIFWTNTFSRKASADQRQEQKQIKRFLAKYDDTEWSHAFPSFWQVETWKYEHGSLFL